MVEKRSGAYYRVYVSSVYRWEKAGVLPAPEKEFGAKRFDRDR
jgi:hypothetical protein